MGNAPGMGGPGMQGGGVGNGGMVPQQQQHNQQQFGNDEQVSLNVLNSFLVQSALIIKSTVKDSGHYW